MDVHSNSESKDEIDEILDNLKNKNLQQREWYNYSKKENLNYRSRYKDLKQRMTAVTKLLQRNAHIFHELFRDASSLFQMSGTLDLDRPICSPLKEKVSERPAKTNSRAGPSGVVIRRKLNIERLNVLELKEALEKEDSLREVHTGSGSLTTILEENSENIAPNHTKSVNNVPKEPYVNLSRLPDRVVMEHLQKRWETEHLDSQVSFSSCPQPVNTSTPLKLELMSMLNLRPCVVSHSMDFFNASAIAHCSKSLVVQSENVEQKTRNSITFKKPKRVKKENDVKSPLIKFEKRPTRKARPAQLKEPSLMQKLRRE